MRQPGTKLTKRPVGPTVRGVKRCSKWLRALAVMLLCVLMSTPGAIHGRVCLMDLGLLERDACCPPTLCCEAPQGSAGDTLSLSAGEDSCGCCLELNLEGRGPIAAAASASSAQDPGVAGASLPPAASLLLFPPPPAERSKTIVTRSLGRTRMAAPVPLRI